MGAKGIYFGGGNFPPLFLRAGGGKLAGNPDFSEIFWACCGILLYVIVHFMFRRDFIKNALSAIGAASLAKPAFGETPAGKPGEFREPARSVPLNSDYDIIVCGGGPAGIGAAIGAARSGISAGASFVRRRQML